MKKIISLIIIIASVLNAKGQMQKSITISDNDEYNVSFLTSSIDEIRYLPADAVGQYVQEVYTNGMVYRFNLTENSLTHFGNVNTSEICVYKDNIGDWDEVRMMADGSLYMQKANLSNPDWKDIVMLLPNEETGAYLYTVVIDNNSMPKYITINDCIVKVDRYDTESIDISIVYNDTISQSFTNLEWRNHSKPVSRAWNENNWQRNLAGIIELAAGAACVIQGSLTIAGSVVSEVGTLGASTPISVPGIAVGTLAITGGCSTFKDGFNKLWLPGESHSDIVGNVANQAISTALQNEKVLSLVPDKYFAYLKDPNYKPSDVPFYASLFAGVFDNIFGKTVTWEDIAEFYKGKVLTGVSTDVTYNSATLRGYVYPEVTRSPLNGKKFENEYGIILSTAQGNKSNIVKKISNGDGGVIEFNFEDLSPHTTYNYQAYYYDRTNTIFQRGETRTFRTLAVVPKVTAVKVIGCEEGSYYNEGIAYKYKFNVGTTVEIKDLKDVADWGYVYKDPNGNIKHISLKGHSSPYTDTSYAYYRNETKSTACLYGYVKYEGDSQYYYDEPKDWPLEMSFHSCPDNHHPHAIDLGLPSGTKWCCMNVGATSPEGYGGYYAWGETNEKSWYDWESYLYRGTSYPECQNIGSNIAGTSYDVAHVRMGGSWRMPSVEQQDELVRYCTSTWTQQNGVDGRLMTGVNGGQIFLPAAGHRNNRGLDLAGSGGYYWSSSLYEGYLGFAYELYFNPIDVFWYDTYRYYGRSVRAVCP